MFLRDTLILWSPAVFSVIAVLAGLRFFDWWLLKRHSDMGSEKKLPRQLAMLALTGVSMTIVLLTLPLQDSIRNQLLAILGLIATAIMGLSSTTLVSNAMASVMLRTTNSIRTGDYLPVGEHFGRVTERGLMHTEIQMESRELTTLPNSFLISNPFTIVRSSGTIISISGFLSDVKRLLSAHSDSCKAVIGSLHCAGVEIVSPGFMNQRSLSEGAKVILNSCDLGSESNNEQVPEEMMVDKADDAEQVKIVREKLEAELKVLEQQAEEAENDAREQIQMRNKVRAQQLADLNNRVSEGLKDKA